ncbi:MAG TPA: hypothetical protein VF145_01110 [Chitinophagaceae bacterium]
MAVTLVFPSYYELADFLSVAKSPDIQMDLQSVSLSAPFQQEEVRMALAYYDAEVKENTPPGGRA